MAYRMSPKMSCLSFCISILTPTVIISSLPSSPMDVLDSAAFTTFHIFMPHHSGKRKIDLT